VTGKEGGAELDALRAQQAGRRDPAAVHDPARGEHRHGHRVDHLRHERQRPDQGLLHRRQKRRSVPARLEPLRHDGIHAGLVQCHRLGDRRRRTDGEGVGVALLGGPVSTPQPLGGAERSDARSCRDAHAGVDVQMSLRPVRTGLWSASGGHEPGPPRKPKPFACSALLALRVLHQGIRPREHEHFLPVITADEVRRRTVSSSNLDDLGALVGRTDDPAVHV